MPHGITYFLDEHMTDTKINPRYLEFLFKRQFKRKISPAVFALSKPVLKIAAIGALGYLFLPEKYAPWALGLAAFFAAKKYLKTGMSFRAVNAEWAAGREDESIPLLSYYAKKKEFYLKNSIEIKRGGSIK
jgi:hypothetical protein